MKRERTGIAARGGTVAVGVLAQCGLWAALAGMGMAWSATMVRFSPWGGGWGTEACRVWGWALLYAVLATALAWLLRMLSRHMRPACFLLACMGISLAGQAVLIGLSGSGWRPTNDAAIFTRYLDHLAANGSGPEALGALSDQYDYRVWTRRAHPFYLPLRKAAGADFGRAVQMVQAVLSVLPMLFVWRMLAVLFGRKTAVWATVFQTVFPFRWIACLELNHHLPGGLLFSAALWVLVEFFRVGHGRTGRLALFAAACLLLPLMELEGGIDWVYGVSVLAVCMGLAVAGRLKIRDAAVALAGLWLVPLLVARMAVGPLLARIDAADLHHLESGAVAQHGALRGARGAAGEEDGGGALLVDPGSRDSLVGDARCRNDLHALQFRAQRRKFVAHEEGGDVELHAAADDGLLRQGGREHHGHIAGAGDGQEELDGVLAVAVEDGDVRAFLQAELLDEGAAAGDALTHLLIGVRPGQVGKSRHIGIFGGDPVDEFGNGRDITETLHVFSSDHIIEIVVSVHGKRVLNGLNLIGSF